MEPNVQQSLTISVMTREIDVLRKELTLIKNTLATNFLETNLPKHRLSPLVRAKLAFYHQHKAAIVDEIRRERSSEQPVAIAWNEVKQRSDQLFMNHQKSFPPGFVNGHPLDQAS